MCSAVQPTASLRGASAPRSSEAMLEARRSRRGAPRQTRAGLSGGTARPLATSQPRSSGPQSHPSRGPEPWRAQQNRRISMSLRPTNKTRLGTLLVTAVPVTALGLATGAGAGAPLPVVGAIALAAGLLLGALLASSVPTPATAEPAHSPRHRTFGVRALLSRAAHE